MLLGVCRPHLACRLLLQHPHPQHVRHVTRQAADLARRRRRGVVWHLASLSSDARGPVTVLPIAEETASPAPVTGAPATSAAPHQAHTNDARERWSASPEDGTQVAASDVSNDDSTAATQTLVTVEDVLSAVGSRSTDIPVLRAAELMLKLTSLTKSVEGFREDVRFKNLVNSLQGRKVQHLRIRVILALLKALESLDGMGFDNTIKENLITTLLWHARAAPMKELTMLLSFTAHRQDSDIQVRLLKEVVDVLERRWVEIVDGASLTGVLHYPECFSDKFKNRLDDRIIELSGSLLPSELVQILSKKAEKKLRSLPVLKSLAFHVAKNAKDLNAKEISDCLYAMKTLSYVDEELIKSLCDGAKINTLDNHAVLRSILTSLGVLRFRHETLLDNITEWYIQRSTSLQSRDLITFLLTTAKLNYIPTNSDTIYKMVLERVTYESLRGEEGFEVIWLDVVWALCVLGKQTFSHLGGVLGSDFCNKLLSSHDQRNVGVILKILNVNAVGTYATTGYDGPLIAVENDPLLNNVKLVESASNTRFRQLVTESFSSLASPPTHARLNVNTMMGFHCDIECVMDPRGKPLPIKEFGLFGRPQEDCIRLPDEATRVAIIGVPYNMSLIDGSVSGLNALYERLLKSRGFKVLLVNFKEITSQQTRIDRIKALEAKLKNLLSSDKT